MGDPNADHNQQMLQALSSEVLDVVWRRGSLSETPALYATATYRPESGQAYYVEVRSRPGSLPERATLNDLLADLDVVFTAVGWPGDNRVDLPTCQKECA